MHSKDIVETAVEDLYKELLKNGSDSSFTKSELKDFSSQASQNLLKAINFFFVGDSLVNFNSSQLSNFNKKHKDIWQLQIALLERYVSFTCWLSEVNASSFNPDKNYENEIVLTTVLLNLHARACLVSKEILALLNNGFADAAISRWRTLYEVSTTLMFIKDNGEKCAIQFYDHNIVDKFNSSKILLEMKNKYPNRLANTTIDMDNFKELEIRVDELKLKYSKDFVSDYGWVVGFIDYKGRPPGFRAIEKSVGIDQLQPYAKLANQNLHSSSQSMFYSLSAKGNDQFLNIGNNHIGLETPIDCTVLILEMINKTLLNHFKGIDNTISIAVLSYYFNKIRESLQDYK